MTRKRQPVNLRVTDYLIQAGETFNLLQTDSQEAIIASEWLEKNFPIASWGRIDWPKVPNSSCITWTDDSELLLAFQRILVESRLDNNLEITVIVIWANGLRPSLQISLDTFLK